MAAGTHVYSDAAAAFASVPGFDREAVQTSLGEYVGGSAHTSGVESFWALFKSSLYETPTIARAGSTLGAK